MTDFDHPDERRATAGEYVLGTLDAQDASAFEAALRDDEALRREVYAWQDRLLALSAQAAPADPSPVLWKRIEVAVDATVRPVVAATSAVPWWRRTLPWQAIGGLALASSAALAVLLVLRIGSPPRDHYLAVLQSPSNQVNGWVVDIEAGRVRLVPVNAAAPVPAGRSLQFWTKPQGAAAPTSLGLVRAGVTTELPTSRLPSIGDQQLFEITLEPAEGSPVGRPTGPILFVGRSVLL